MRAAGLARAEEQGPHEVGMRLWQVDAGGRPRGQSLLKIGSAAAASSRDGGSAAPFNSAHGAAARGSRQLLEAQWPVTRRPRPAPVSSSPSRPAFQRSSASRAIRDPRRAHRACAACRSAPDDGRALGVAHRGPARRRAPPAAAVWTPARPGSARGPYRACPPSDIPAPASRARAAAEVGHRAARAACLRDSVGSAELVDQPREAIRLLERVQVTRAGCFRSARARAPTGQAPLASAGVLQSRVARRASGARRRLERPPSMGRTSTGCMMPCSRSWARSSTTLRPRTRLVLARTQAVDGERLQRFGRGRLVGTREQRVEPAAQSLRSDHRRSCRRQAAAGAAAASSIRRRISPASARYACAPFEVLSRWSTGMPCDGASARRTLRGTIVR